MITDKNNSEYYLDSPSCRYINRELSWLEFNARVLEEARNNENPLLERVRFLSISASNLDEFFMVRVAGLKHQIHYKKMVLSQDGLSPAEQLTKLLECIKRLLADQYQCWQQLISLLADEGICIETAESLAATDMAWLEDYVSSTLSKHLNGFILESANPFPLLPSLGVALVAALHPHHHGAPHHLLLPLPPVIDRFIRLPSFGKQLRFVPLEVVLTLFQQQLFTTYTEKHRLGELGFLRITRDSELDISDEAEDLVGRFERAVEKRKHGSIVRIEVNKEMSDSLREHIAGAFNADISDIIENQSFPELSVVGQLYSSIIRHDLKFRPFHARFPQRINAFGGDCFKAIAAKDIIVHHPYESFDVVIKFLRQAAKDPSVLSIKQTLYRTSSDSEIVKALIEAAEAGKDVTAIVELKARFDEESNIRWARNLKKAGAKVIFGVPGLKVHSKVSLVQRRQGDKLQSYVHFGTGNYHSVTARTYVDLSFFTCDPILCEDAEKLFEFMSVGTEQTYQKLIIAPLNLRSSMITLIADEIAHANAGRPAMIWLKLNALVDRELIDALYKASEQGVKITLIVRGICALRPGVPGLSDNITVKSIVGRFLEHARIFCFGAGHALPSDQAKVYISSADWMYRSCNRRVESVIPILNPTVHAQVLQQIMVSNINDEKQSWLLAANGNYNRIATQEGFSAQEYFMVNRSLSGINTAVPHEQHYISTGSEVASVHHTIGVIDIGSNSVRLVVYDGLKRVPLPLFNEKVLCGLARELEQTNRLHREAMVLAHQALARFIHLARIMHVHDLHIFATAAVRDAVDGKEFVAQVEARHGVNIRILSGEEEATYAAYGVLSSMPEARGIIGDLGGGSLELAQIHNHEVSLLHTFPLGVLRLVASGDAASLDATSNKKTKTIATIDKHLARFPVDALRPGDSFYAIGGGFRNLAKIYIALTHYPLRILHHYSVTSDKFLEVLHNISRIPLQTLQEMSGMSGKRAETLPYTALVMERIIAKFKPSTIVFSAAGVREGFLYASLPESHKIQDPLFAACNDMISPIEEHSDYSHELFEWMHPLFELETENTKRLRLAACILTSLARYEHTEYRAEIAYRRFLDSSICGIDHASRLFIACILFHRYKSTTDPLIMQAAMELLDDETMMTARVIGLAMRLAHNISASVPGIIHKTRLIVSRTTLNLQFDPDVSDLMGEAVTKRLEKLAMLLKLTPVIEVRS